MGAEQASLGFAFLGPPISEVVGPTTLYPANGGRLVDVVYQTQWCANARLERHTMRPAVVGGPLPLTTILLRNYRKESSM